VKFGVVYDRKGPSRSIESEGFGYLIELRGSMKTLLIAAVKVILTLGLFALAFRSIDIGDVILHIRQLPLSLLALVIGLLLCQMIMSGIRLSSISGMIVSRVPLVTALRLNWIGSFFSLALVTFVSGDVVRTMVLRRTCHLGMRDSVGIITLDRIVGLLAILVIVSITAPWAIQLTADERIRRSIEVLAVIGAVIVVGFGLVGFLARRSRVVESVRAKISGSKIVYILLDVMTVARHLFDSRREIPKIVVISLLIQIINVAVIFFLINGMGAQVSIWQCMLIVPTVMLISLLPFSVAGWGLRESAMATGFALIQAPAAPAVAASVMFGVLTLAIALPGGLLWWSSRIVIPPRSASA
jgi:glycosyltransferase 2 family protein